MFWGVHAVVREIRRTFPFDLIHAHVALPDGFAGLLLARCFRCPLVVTVHGQDLQQTVEVNKRCKGLVGQVLRSADRVIFVSTKLQKLALRLFQLHAHTVVIHSGVEPAHVVVPVTQARLRNQGPVVLLTVGGLLRTKGVDLVLRAVSLLLREGFELLSVVIGTGPEEGALRRLAQVLDIEENVHFMGALPHDEVMQHMASCDVFCLPSWKEGFGVVYLEAMASGKPVIACAGEGIEDVVEDGATGLLVNPQDLADLVRALRSLLAQPEERLAMGERAKKAVLAGYTWETSARACLDLYGEVLCEAARRNAHVRP
jgi:glycosyltransferase involved in cell wall biosynthesis